MRQDESGAGSGKQRKPRRLAALGAAGDHARRLQELGDALDDAVRAVRTHDALAEGLCRRVHELWMSERRHVLEWHPTELRADGKVVLAASGQGGRFVLPAFYAGLRALGMREQCAPSDVLRLLERLAALETAAQSPEEFARWLYQGGALGFDAAQDDGVFELHEALVPPPDERALWGERSTQAVELWNDLAWKAAHAFDGRTLAERYRTPIEHVHARVQRGEIALGEDDKRALRDAADDDAAWARAELGLLLAEPELRATLSSAHVSYRLAAVLQTSAELDSRLPELFAALSGGGGRAAAVEARILGGAFGQRLLGAGVEPNVVLGLAERIGPDLIAGVLAHLNAAERSSEAALRMLCALLQRGGLRGVLSRVDVNRMRPALASALLCAALETRVPASEILDALERLPTESALAALASAPAFLRVADPVLRGLIAHRLEELEPRLPAFVRSSPAAAQAAAAAIVPTCGDRFTLAGLQAIFEAFIEMGVGREVIAIWEARRAGASARIAALSALELDRRLLAEALARRGPELADPPDVRSALEELRWRQL